MPRSATINNESLAVYVNGLLDQLRSNGYSETTVLNYFHRLRPIQTFMAENHIQNYSPETGDAYFEFFIQTHDVCSVGKRELRAHISRLNDLYNGYPFVHNHTNYEVATIPSYFQEIINEFFNDVDFFSNSKSTVSRRTRALARFLGKCVRCNASAVDDLNLQIVLLSCKDVTDIDDWITIRQFLWFLAKRGKTVHDLSTFVPKASREKKVPSTYSIEEIQSMEYSLDRTTLHGKRDYVVLLMAGRLAIRACDIAAMKRENLDFTNESISFMQKKTNNEITLPMIPELKEATEDYLDSSADIEDGFVFHTLLAPHRPLSSGQAANIINRCFKRAGIDTTGKKHGSHTLRASASTSMINDGIPYEAVRSILGHTSPNSITHYAKNDMEGLRRCAIPVPTPTGTFRKFLEGGVQP